MKRGDRPFVVGRKTSKTTTLVVLDRDPRAEPRPRIRGPWSVRAVVTPVRPVRWPR